jgi:hypothetical protein
MSQATRDRAMSRIVTAGMIFVFVMAVVVIIVGTLWVYR